ncbi:hypothetical protein B9Z55_005800 [Caenorhabditis nigoni]|uniref:Uncharacterized protein n=1 Tax=Caenorhabditis nigoni TaxID=1611254 RepID=A0A2G5V2V2_9PELO|nr:hypothetical protein B9Z55_005800 [Caenorhabditis nigoni]
MGEIEHTSWTSIGLDERLEDVAEKVSGKRRKEDRSRENFPEKKNNKMSIFIGHPFAIIACDGLWKSFTNVEAVTYASEQLEVAKKVMFLKE